ncbi:MAG: GNAT family N-acetyltransferase [Nitrospira sp.]|nr:GNAT family N-acetyltransferase [Nitrospira sp.]
MDGKGSSGLLRGHRLRGTILTIPRSRVLEWETLLRRAFLARWGGSYGRAGYFSDYLAHDPHHRAGRLVGLFVGDTLVSTYQIFSRSVRLSERVYRLEGIGNVATAPEHQRQGYGRALMRSFLQAPRSRRDLAMVYARDGAFYRKLGWRPFSRGVIRIPLRGITPATLGAPVLHRRMNQADLPAVSRIYARFNRAEDLLHVVRTPRYWNEWVWEWKRRVYRLRAEVFTDARRRPIGYAVSRLVGDQFRIEEYGALPSQHDQVYRGLMQLAVQQNRCRFALAMRPVPSLRRWLASMSLSNAVEDGPDELGHVRFFHPSIRRRFSSVALWHIDHF